jgi:hypothetical protein
VINGAPPLPKEDPLVSYVPPVITPVSEVRSVPVDPLTLVPTMTPTIAAAQPMSIVPETNDTVPDWLKATSNTVLEIPKIESAPMAHPIDSMSPLFEVNTPEPTPVVSTPTTTLSDDGIPDWIKNSPTTETTLATDPLMPPTDTTVSSDPMPDAAPASEQLPDWLMSSLQSDIAPETTLLIDDTIETPTDDTTGVDTPVVTKTPKKSKKTQSIPKETAPTKDTGDIPSWLK